MNTDIKQGWKTTEFWMTILVSVFSGLVLLNLMNQEQATAWLAIFAPLIGVILPVLLYADGRARVKASVVNNASADGEDTSVINIGIHGQVDASKINDAPEMTRATGKA